jgi:hypothetical protein
MTAPASFTDFVQQVVNDARAITPRPTVELGILHSFCLDAAQARRPQLVDFLTSPGGLAALSAALAQLPDLVRQADVDGARWEFVRNEASGGSKAR